MNKNYTLFFSFQFGISTHAVTFSINPPTFEETTSITITINGSSVNEAAWGVNGNVLYPWAWF
jgi:hypothetical protein